MADYPPAFRDVPFDAAFGLAFGFAPFGFATFGFATFGRADFDDALTVGLDAPVSRASTAGAVARLAIGTGSAPRSP